MTDIDTLIGSAGNDTFTVDNTLDEIVENLNTDLLFYNISLHNLY